MPETADEPASEDLAAFQAAFLTARLDEDERYLKSNQHHLWTQRPLRRVAATRALVAAILAEPHDHARNPAGHQRVTRLLTIIASEWEE